MAGELDLLGFENLEMIFKIIWIKSVKNKT